MRIENLTKLLAGEIVNSPAISQIESIKTKACYIQRADLFVATDNKDIDLAIKNGAYGIIFDKEIKITDNEIAWIKVDNIEKALIRYLRYKVIQLLPKIYLFDDITVQIIKNITKGNNISCLDGDIFDNFSKIMASNSETIFVCNDKKFFGKINPASISEEFTAKEHVKVIKHSLLKIDFVYNENIYRDKVFPYLFIENLNRAIEFAQKLYLEISLENIAPINHFEPIFIDNNLQIKKFGETGRVLLLEQDNRVFKKESIYLKENAKYAKNILCIPGGLEDNFDLKSIKYRDFYDIIATIKEDYNFFLILSNDCEGFKSFLNSFNKQNDNTRSLF